MSLDNLYNYLYIYITDFQIHFLGNEIRDAISSYFEPQNLSDPICTMTYDPLYIYCKSRLGMSHVSVP